MPALGTQKLTEQGFPAFKETPVCWAVEEEGVSTWPPFLWHQEEVLTVLDKGKVAPEINTKAVPPVRP